MRVKVSRILKDLLTQLFQLILKHEIKRLNQTKSEPLITNPETELE